MDELVLSSEYYAFGYSNMLLTYCSTSRQRKDLTAQACWLQFHNEPDEGHAFKGRKLGDCRLRQSLVRRCGISKT